MPALPAQPQTIGKVLDSGIKLYIRGLGKSLIVLLLTFVVVAVISTLSAVAIRFSGASSSRLLYFIGLMVVLGLVLVAMYGAITKIYGDLGAGTRPTVGGSLKKGLAKSFPLFVTTVFYSIFINIMTYGPAYLLGSILKNIGLSSPGTTVVMILIAEIPAVLFMLSLKFYDTAIVLDNKGMFNSLSYSHSLVWGNWWRTSAVYLVPIVLAFVLFMIFYFVVGVGAFLSTMHGGQPTPGQFLPISSFLVLSLIIALIVPLFPAVSVALYHDLKLRKSGGDLEARLAGV